MKTEKYYQVQCDDAPTPDKSFNLSETTQLKNYLRSVENLKYEIYFVVWNESKQEIEQMINVTEEF